MDGHARSLPVVRFGDLLPAPTYLVFGHLRPGLATRTHLAFRPVDGETTREISLRSTRLFGGAA